MMIKINFDGDGYAANWADVGDVENSVGYDGPVPEGFAENCRRYRIEDGRLVRDADKMAAGQSAASVTDELDGLYAWFGGYDLQVKKWERGRRIGTPRDDIDMRALDAEAERKRASIRRLKGKGD